MPSFLFVPFAVVAAVLVVTARRPGAFRVEPAMIAPIRCENEREFLLVPGAGGGGVTWAMHGVSPFIAKLMGLVVNTERMAGREMETGLAALEAQAESKQVA